MILLLCGVEVFLLKSSKLRDANLGFDNFLLEALLSRLEHRVLLMNCCLVRLEAICFPVISCVDISANQTLENGRLIVVDISN